MVPSLTARTLPDALHGIALESFLIAGWQDDCIRESCTLYGSRRFVIEC
jgi:hypothetical protein